MPFSMSSRTSCSPLISPTGVASVLAASLRVPALKVTGRGDQPLLMSSEAHPNLLNNYSFEVSVPFLDSYAHASSNHVAHNQSATDIDTAILASAGCLDFLETRFRQCNIDSNLRLSISRRNVFCRNVKFPHELAMRV